MNHDDAKIEFYKEIKNIEAKLDHSDLTLNSFILSITPMKDILNNTLSEEEFAEKNVLFMVGNGTAYLGQMFKKILEKYKNIPSTQVSTLFGCVETWVKFGFIKITI